VEGPALLSRELASWEEVRDESLSSAASRTAAATEAPSAPCLFGQSGKIRVVRASRNFANMDWPVFAESGFLAWTKCISSPNCLGSLAGSANVVCAIVGVDWDVRIRVDIAPATAALNGLGAMRMFSSGRKMLLLN